MGKLPITFAVDRYDYLRPLIDRVIEPEGIDLRIIEVPAGLRHERMYRHEEYDACEFALGGHIVAVSRRLLQGRAIPAFPRRMFPHKFLAVRVDGGIDSPEDLVGKKVGIVSYENSLQIPVRSAFKHQYGLPNDAIHWMVVDRGLLGIEAVEGVRMEVIGPRPGLEERLVAGELDAIVVPFIVEPLIKRDPRVRDLFRDPKSEEKRYYEATGHFPIMHDVLLKQSVLDENPWVAHSLLDALRKSRQIHFAWMEQPPNMSFAWARELLLEERAFFGPRQWEDGFEANRGQLDLMCRYAYEQGMTAELVDPASMFVPSTLGR